MRISTIRSICYLIGKILGDVSAVSQGTGAMGKRLMRLAAGKGTGRWLGKLFR